MLAFTGGIRPGELLALFRGDVDLTAAQIDIRRALSYRGKRIRIKVPKTAKSVRSIPLCSELVAILKEQLDSQLQRLTELGVQVDAETPLFDCGDGHLWHPDSFRRGLKNCLAEQKLPPFQWRGTRHTFATLAIGIKKSPPLMFAIYLGTNSRRQRKAAISTMRLLSKPAAR